MVSEPTPWVCVHGCVRALWMLQLMIKGKAIPLQGLTGPEGSSSLRLPDFKKIGTWIWQGCQPYATAAFTPRKYSWDSFLLEAWSTPGPECGRKDYVNEKFQWHHRDLPVCSAVAQPLRHRMPPTADGTYSNICAQRGYLHVCWTRFALISPEVIITILWREIASMNTALKFIIIKYSLLFIYYGNADNVTWPAGMTATCTIPLGHSCVS
jgi:hypothetical protein